MKKLFLFVAVATLGLTTSCSSDDDGGNGGNSELKVTIDGVQKTFNSIVVNKETYTDSEDGETWTELTVTATINNDPSEIIIFQVDEGETGAYAIWSFNYTKAGISYDFWNGSATFSSVVQTNSNKKLKGTFTGSLVGWSNETGDYVSVQTTNGSFDISYQ